MCTILTIDRAFYAAHRDDVRARIQADSETNSDGASLLTIGSEYKDGVLVRALSIGIVLGVLDAELGPDGSAERAWVHLRFATTGYKGLNGCHGFAAGDWTVFHNGSLSRPGAHRFDVDSELIASDIAANGIEAAIRGLDFDSFANVFLVNNRTGAFHVVRRTSGQLHTDGNGNFSTHPVAGIATAVPHATAATFAAIVIPPVRVARDTRWSPLDATRWDYSASERAIAWDRWDDRDASLDIVDALDEVNDVLECLQYLESFDDFADMADAEGWVAGGIPEQVQEHLNVQHLQWASQMGLFKRRAVG